MDSVTTNAGSASGTAAGGLKEALVIDTEKVRGHLDEVVRSTVEQTLNQLLDEVVDRLHRAARSHRRRLRRGADGARPRQPAQPPGPAG